MEYSHIKTFKITLEKYIGGGFRKETLDLLIHRLSSCGCIAHAGYSGWSLLWRKTKSGHHWKELCSCSPRQAHLKIVPRLCPYGLFCPCAVSMGQWHTWGGWRVVAHHTLPFKTVLWFRGLCWGGEERHMEWINVRGDITEQKRKLGQKRSTEADKGKDSTGIQKWKS